MALTGNYGYTNVTPVTEAWYPIDLDVEKDYAVVVDDPGKCVLRNTTGPIDQAESIVFMARTIEQVQQSEKNMYPPKVRTGNQLSVKLENKKRMTSSTDDTFIEDCPINCSISWQYLKSRNFTDADLLAVALRLIGALVDPNSQAATIISKLMMEQLNPVR